ncbi:MAG: hypothetical protein JWM91_5324 [Rhodospirillales bacterium]|nr:hypothetical protein [Rhodospirillales bacterium]
MADKAGLDANIQPLKTVRGGSDLPSVILRKAADSGESSGGAFRQASSRTDNVPNFTVSPTLIGRCRTRAVILSKACSMATGWSIIVPGGKADGSSGGGATAGALSLGAGGAFLGISSWAEAANAIPRARNAPANVLNAIKDAPAVQVGEPVPWPLRSAPHRQRLRRRYRRSCCFRRSCT